MDDKDFEKLLEQSVQERSRRVSVGDEIEGLVVGESNTDFFVDYGGKSEALLPKDEAEEGTAVGQRVNVMVRRISGGTVYLAGKISRQSVDRSAIQMAYESGRAIEGRVAESRKGGFSVELGPKIWAFCPISQIDDRYVTNPEDYVNKTLWFKIIEFSDSGDIVVSHRAYVQELKEKDREKLLRSLAPGDVYDGRVTRIMDYGAFVDIGGAEGLLHVSQISWDQVRPIDVLEEGQEIRVKVIDVQHKPDGSVRISLSLKALERDPWETFEGLREGEVLEGEVVRIKPFGAFVRLAPGVEGLLHISEMAWYRVSRVEDLLRVGDTVKVKILSVDRDSKRISLSLREVEGAPEGEVAEGAEVDGIVHEIKNFGVFVTLPGGRVGLLPKRELGTVNPMNAFHQGQKVRVLITAVDEENGRISLTTTDRRELLEEGEDYKKFTPKGSGSLATLGELLGTLKKDGEKDA